MPEKTDSSSRAKQSGSAHDQATPMVFDSWGDCTSHMAAVNDSHEVLPACCTVSYSIHLMLSRVCWYVTSVAKKEAGS